MQLLPKAGQPHYTKRPVLLKRLSQASPQDRRLLARIFCERMQFEKVIDVVLRMVCPGRDHHLLKNLRVLICQAGQYLVERMLASPKLQPQALKESLRNEVEQQIPLERFLALDVG